MTMQSAFADLSARDALRPLADTNFRPRTGRASSHDQHYRANPFPRHVPILLLEQLANERRQINYTLNHKIRGAGTTNLAFLKDVQTAIWVLMGEQNPEFGVSATARQMIDAANANANFVPGSGDTVAVLLYSDGIRVPIRRGKSRRASAR